MPRTTPLKLAILASGMTQLEVAAKVGLAQSVLNMIVNGHKEPSPEQARELARVLRKAQRDIFVEDANE